MEACPVLKMATCYEKIRIQSKQSKEFYLHVLLEELSFDRVAEFYEDACANSLKNVINVEILMNVLMFIPVLPHLAGSRQSSEIFVNTS